MTDCCIYVEQMSSFHKDPFRKVLILCLVLMGLMVSPLCAQPRAPKVPSDILTNSDEETSSTFKVQYRGCKVEMDEVFNLVITGSSDSSSVKIMRLSKMPASLQDTAGIKYIEGGHFIPRISIEGDFGKILSNCPIGEVSVTGNLASITTKMCHVERVSARTLNSIKMTAYVMSDDIPSSCVATSIYTEFAHPMKMSLQGVVLQNFDTNQDMKTFSMSSKVWKDELKAKHLSLGGIGAPEDVISLSFRGEYRTALGNSSIKALKIKNLSAKGCAIISNTIEGGLESIAVVSQAFTVEGSVVQPEANLLVRKLVSTDVIKSIKVKGRKGGDGDFGGVLGDPFDPTSMRIQSASDIKSVFASRCISANIWAGYIGSNVNHDKDSPAYSGYVKKIAVTAGGEILGEAHVLPSQIKFVPEQGEFKIINTIQKGSVVVNGVPSTGRWVLNGPAAFAENEVLFQGAKTFQDAPIGEYTMTCQNLFGYHEPEPFVKVLSEGKTISFDASWAIYKGNITVDVSPENAIWTISGPIGFEGMPETYTGDHEFNDVPVGLYTLACEYMKDHTAPPIEERLVSDGDSIVFNLQWEPYLPGSININATPNTGSWLLRGPQGFAEDNQVFVGDKLLNDLPIGEYFLVSQYLSGYNTPTTLSTVLTDGGNFTFTPTWTLYVPSGTVSVVCTPVDGHWTLAGPWGFIGNGKQYSGDMTFDNVPTGTYKLSCAQLDQHISPKPLSKSLVDHGEIVFSPKWIVSGGTLVSTVEHKITPIYTEYGAAFGTAVDIWEDNVIVGAYNDLEGGCAYVFGRTEGVMKSNMQIRASDAVINDQFGYSVAIHGNSLIVGSKYKTAYGYIQSGAAYIFSKSGSTWSEQSMLTDNDIVTHGLFGTSVAIYDETAVVGGHWNRNTYPNSSYGAGAICIFKRSGSTWLQKYKILASTPSDTDRFGASISISGDTIIVGSPGANFGTTPMGTRSGAVYILSNNGGVWSEVKKFLPTLDLEWKNEFNLGVSVSVSGDLAIAGAPGEDIVLNNGQGAAIQQAGAAYIYSRNESTWVQEAKITASDIASNTYFGTSVSIDNNIAVVSSPKSKKMYVFTRNSNNVWIEQGIFTPPDPSKAAGYGTSVSISNTHVIVGAAEKRTYFPNEETVYIYELIFSLN